MTTFNVRVYGILFNQEKNAILISDEKYHNVAMTKFVGGGLEYGEGTLDALKREFKEELAIEIEITQHFYTTDFFVTSAFKKDSQVIAIYYLVKSNELEKIKIDSTYQLAELNNNEQFLRWLPINEIAETEFTFLIDKKVANLLIQYIQK
jgi:8-oxo-dGTP diphosphatase